MLNFAKFCSCFASYSNNDNCSTLFLFDLFLLLFVVNNLYLVLSHSCLCSVFIVIIINYCYVKKVILITIMSMTNCTLFCYIILFLLPQPLIFTLVLSCS